MVLLLMQGPVENDLADAAHKPLRLKNDNLPEFHGRLEMKEDSQLLRAGIEKDGADIAAILTDSHGFPRY